MQSFVYPYHPKSTEMLDFFSLYSSFCRPRVDDFCDCTVDSSPAIRFSSFNHVLGIMRLYNELYVNSNVINFKICHCHCTV